LPHCANCGRVSCVAGDILGVIEAAYAGGQSDAGWLAALLRATAPLLDEGLGAFSHSYATDPDGTVRILAMQSLSGPATEEFLAHLQSMVPRGPDPLFRQLYPHAPTAGTATQLTGRAVWQFPELSAEGRDAVGIMAGNPSGQGVVVHAMRRVPLRLKPTDRRLWSCVAAHIASGYRLRLREPSTEAVVTPAGRVEHAEGAATGAPERAALGEAARCMDKARGKMRRAEPAEALALWRGLVAGQWSLVEQIDSDGRRYLFARKNAPEVRAWRDLTQKERQVLAYAAEGHGHKMIGYEMGTSVSTVAALLRSAAHKVGAKSRLELVRLYKRSEAPAP
jgi:DNA-binding CsgD family transcriptional regulator